MVRLDRAGEDNTAKRDGARLRCQENKVGQVGKINVESSAHVKCNIGKDVPGLPEGARACTELKKGCARDKPGNKAAPPDDGRPVPTKGRYFPKQESGRKEEPQQIHLTAVVAETTLTVESPQDPT